MVDLCGEPHPDLPDVSCDKEVPCHYFHCYGSMSWGECPDPPQRTGSRRKQADEIADGAKPEDLKGPAVPDGRKPSKFARNSDPPSAHEAIERYEPNRKSAKGRVLAYLRARPGEWVDAPDLTDNEIGRFGGTRRLRELRQAGWPIETRPKPGATNTWQHRILPE